MEAIDVLKTLMYESSVYPTQAAEEAYSRIDEFKPHLLEAVEFAAKSPKAVLKSESQLHLYSLFILARARVQEAYIPALKILLIGSRTLATLVLDFIKKSYYHRILASLFDGNLEPITGILSEPGHCEYLYSTALDTFCLLAKKNIIDRNEAIDFLNSLIADRGEECARHEVPEAVQFLSREEATANKQHPSRHHHKRDYWELINDFNAIVHINDWADPDDGYPMLRFREDDSVTPEEWRRSDYETPSLHFRGSKPSKSAKTARNDPCPCGSGKKYKKCCGG